MTKHILIETRDRVIWNQRQLLLQISSAMSKNFDITIDLNLEGPDCQDIGIYDILESYAKEFNYDISKINIITCNFLETHPQIKINKYFAKHLLEKEIDKNYDHDFFSKKQKELLHFGRFICRSNAPRLIISTYLHDNHSDKTIDTYHYNPSDDYHKDEIGLESLINDYGIKDITSFTKFLSQCPKKIIDKNFSFDKSKPEEYSNQMFLYDKEKFLTCYKKFFVEIISETYFNGNTFFVTEKTWRPILLKTPFIIQGSTGFLKNLKNMGFKTFDKWWDEGYDEDPPSWSIYEIIKIIDFLAKKTQLELQEMLSDMQKTLDHNHSRLLELAKIGV
jgi:hypothetical protein